MAKIGEKLKLSLDECRILVLGTQVLISLQFDLAFQSNFHAAPMIVQKFVAIGLALLLAAFVFLQWGPAYFRISLRGQVVDRANAFLIATMIGALLPISAAMGVDAFIVFDTTCGQLWGIASGVAVFCFCITAWYGLGWAARRSRPPEVKHAMKESPQPPKGASDLHERVVLVMTEARVVLPGAQAMLGFEFITFFTRSFAELPAYVRHIHLTCASLVALTVVLLMTPAAFHRLAEAGEESERLVRVASRCVIAAMLPLAIGMCGDFFVVVMKITGSSPLAAGVSGAMLCLFLSLWFGYTLARRSHWKMGFA